MFIDNYVGLRQSDDLQVVIHLYKNNFVCYFYVIVNLTCLNII